MNKLLMLLGIIFMAIILSIIFAFPLMWLWNWLMPTLFKVPEITFLQAIGLNILSNMLFKSSSNLNYKNKLSSKS